MAEAYKDLPEAPWAKAAAMLSLRKIEDEKAPAIYLAEFDKFMTTQDLSVFQEDIYNEIVYQWLVAPSFYYKWEEATKRLAALEQYDLDSVHLFEAKYHRAIANSAYVYTQDGITGLHKHVIKEYPKYRDPYYEELISIANELKNAIDSEKDLDTKNALFMIYIRIFYNMDQLQDLLLLCQSQLQKNEPLSKWWAELILWQGIISLKMNDYGQAKFYAKTLLDSGYQSGDLNNHPPTEAVHVLITVFKKLVDGVDVGVLPVFLPYNRHATSSSSWTSHYLIDFGVRLTPASYVNGKWEYADFDSVRDNPTSDWVIFFNPCS